MKTNFFSFVIIWACTLPLYAQKNAAQHPLVGTWQAAEGKYVFEDVFEKVPAQPARTVSGK